MYICMYAVNGRINVCAQVGIYYSVCDECMICDRNVTTTTITATITSATTHHHYYHNNPNYYNYITTTTITATTFSDTTHHHYTKTPTTTTTT